MDVEASVCVCEGHSEFEYFILVSGYFFFYFARVQNILKLGFNRKVKW